MISEVKCCDNMEFMAQFPDKFFDLAIVDPEYGINAGEYRSIGKRKDTDTVTNYNPKKWDSKPPDASFFTELFRVSKNQIVWGGNYFTNHLPPSRGWIYWDKGYTTPDISFADAEFAYTSFDRVIKKIQLKFTDWRNCISNNKRVAISNPNRKIHPTQKPIALYRWLLQNYAKNGWKILDTNLGSQSSRIAADIEGFDFWGCELDPEYFESGCKRYNQHKQQQILF